MKLGQIFVRIWRIIFSENEADFCEYLADFFSENGVVFREYLADFLSENGADFL